MGRLRAAHSLLWWSNTPEEDGQVFLIPVYRFDSRCIMNRAFGWGQIQRIIYRTDPRREGR